MEFSVLLVRDWSYFSDGGVPEDSFALELWLDGVGGDECVEECASEGVVFEYFGVFSLISGVADEQPADAVGGDAVLGVCGSVVEVVTEIFDCAFVVVEAFAFAEYGLVRVSDIEVDGAAVSFVVPFTDVVEVYAFADGPDEVLADELFGILSEILFTDFVFSSEKNGFDVGRDAAGEFVAEGFDCGLNHVIWWFC